MLVFKALLWGMYEYLKEGQSYHARVRNWQAKTASRGQATNLMYQPTLYMQAVTIGHLMLLTRSVSTNRQSPIFSEPNDAVRRSIECPRNDIAAGTMLIALLVQGVQNEVQPCISKAEALERSILLSRGRLQVGC